MIVRSVAICTGLVLGAAAFGLVPDAQALTMKECSAKYEAAKTAGTLQGMKWNDFRKAECGAGASATPAAATQPTPAPTPQTPASTTTAAPKAAPTAKSSDGRQAEYARERACAADWKADKAANKVAAGTKWPQYWSDCNKRKKAMGM